jgi:hypothetical protein
LQDTIEELSGAYLSCGTVYPMSLQLILLCFGERCTNGTKLYNKVKVTSIPSQ